MRKLFFALFIMLTSFAMQAQEEQGTNKSEDISDKVCFRVYATGVKSEADILKIEEDFKSLRGVYKVTHKFKSEAAETTLFSVWAENKFSSIENEKQQFNGVAESTFKDRLLKLGYNIHHVKQVPVK